MGVASNTVETYANSLIREDLKDQYSMISPTLCPFQAMIGTGEQCKSTYVEWPIVTLQDPQNTNRVIEGESDPSTDTPTLGKRVGNFTQISDKKVITSNTSNAVDAAANNIQREAAQVALKLKELKRDIEVMLLQNIAASAGASGTARVAAGLPAWLRTNIKLGSGGAAPTLSGTTEGYPNATLTPGTAAAVDEDDLNDVIQACWDTGAEPDIILVGSNNKRVISETFTGNATRYKDKTDKTLVNAVDFYDSDFGEFTIVPTRFLPTVASSNYPVYLLDPNYLSVRDLEGVKQEPLAKTGHASVRLIRREYTLEVKNEAALGAIYATTGAAA